MRPATWVVAGAVVLVAGGALGAVAATSGTQQPAHAAQDLPANTATVQQGRLSATVSENGTLTYQGQADGSPYTVINQAQGTYTELPALGQVISQGQVLYRVDDSPVVLLYGSTPAYRSLTAGMSGADVAELNADLVALGFATSAQIGPGSAAFDSATTVAVEKLQAALGVPQSGTLGFGQAVFEPAALRVSAVPAPWGGSAQSGQPALQATTTARVVQVALSASQQTEVAVGNTVTITLPNNQTTPGKVSGVGAVATCPSTPGSSGSSSGSAAPGTDACSSGNAANSSPSVTVDIIPSDPDATGTWDQAPVQVGITTASVPHALAVPVTALLAQAGGGYGVEIVSTGGSRHLVGVSLGLFDDAQGLVQVSGPGLAAGQKVVVPST